MIVTNKITTRIVSTVTWEFRPGVRLDPAALAEAIKTTPWSLSEGSLDTGVEIDGHRVVATDFDLTPNEVEILSQELVQDRTFDCLDCSVDTLDIDEYYRLKTPVWLEANPADEGMLCIGCVEERLGRQLIPKDFPQGSSDAPSGSARLRSRLTGEPER